MDATTPTLGLSEQTYREELERELLQALHIHGGEPTAHTIAHAVAHAVARVVELDHLRIAEQLAAAGVRIDDHAAAPASRSGWPLD